MKYFVIILASAAVFCTAFFLDSVDFSSNDVLIMSQASAYYYGTGRRVARRTARRTSRRVARRHNYYGGAAVVAAPVAVAATGVAVGATVVSLPSACSSVVVNGVTYYNCSGTYYQPVYDGPNLVYVVVQPPL